MAEDPEEKSVRVMQEVLDSAGKTVEGLGKSALDAVEEFLKQADAAMPDEEGLKDIARGFGITFGGEKKDGG